jgi:glycosyltransferase involved in cell wall biosynthesis
MDEERVWIDETIEKTIAYVQSGGQFDMSIQVTIPNEFERMAPVNIGYTAGIETTKIAHQWIAKSNEMDKIIVVSNHSKNVFKYTEYQAQNQQTGEVFTLKTKTPVDAVNYPVKGFDLLPDLNLNLPTSFNFLAVAQAGPRKNLHNTIKWFIEEFRNEDVGLVVKSNVSKNSLMDRQLLLGDMQRFLRQQGERQCKVYLLHGDMTDQEMHSLYRHPQIDAFVSLPHGEGFGLPIFEAAYSGLPVIATGWSGQLDFLVDENGREHFYNVAFDLQQVQKEVVWDGVITADSMWAFPREQSAKQQMRTCYENLNNDEIRGTEIIALEQYTKALSERFSPERLYEQFVNLVIGKSNLKPEPINGISFCIPTNGKRMEKTLLTIKSIQKEMKDFPYEIIIAGDVSNFRDIDGVTLLDMSIEAHSRKVAALRNAAADKSNFKTIAWCDDDVILGTDWLKSMIDYSSANGWEVLGNRVLLPDGGRYWDRATLKPHVMVDYEHPEYDRNLYQSSAFMIVRKSVFENVRWNEDRLVYSDREGGIPEDVQYSLDLISGNYRISFNQNATVWHYDDEYTEFNNNGTLQTLKKSLLREKMDMHFFLPECEEFEQILEIYNEQ